MKLSSQIECQLFDISLEDHQQEYTPKLILLKHTVKFAISSGVIHEGQTDKHQHHERHPEYKKVDFVQNKAIFIII